jgi:cyclopropane-fatty-acyl-phospholipid synthase
MAIKYPESQITAVSNSASQKKYIDSLIREKNIKNLEVIKANIVSFQTEKKFDKIISIEMFEHMRNWQKLLKKLSNMLNPGGSLFIHIFTDKTYPYFFELNSQSGWMAKYFFSGGLMPSVNLISYFTEDFSIERLWKVSGLHYHKTLEAWLQKMKRNKKDILSIFRATYGNKNAKKWWNYWKIFFISCSEAFKYDSGNRRFISHYFLKNRTN